jgi:NitT/TauT family transport system permease protein
MPTTDTASPTPTAESDGRLDRELAGIDALGLAVPSAPNRAKAIWSSAWPKLLAIGIFVGAWQAVVWSHWKDPYILPGPVATFRSLIDNRATLARAAVDTLQRGALGFAIATVIGSVVGLAVARSRVLRSGVGSMITGLQTMPSIAWFPLAIVLFHLSIWAVLFVVILGAAPSIANGLLTGIDNIPPILLRAGRVLGATGWSALRHVILPAAMPSFVGGLKQGWAFAWRSLLAGELIGAVAGTHALGQVLDADRSFSDYTGMMAAMVTIFIVGVAMDAAVFGQLDRFVRRRHGLIDTAT